MASPKCSDICANKKEYTPMCTYCTQNRIIPKGNREMVESYMEAMETKKNFGCYVQLESFFDISVFGYELDEDANSRECGGMRKAHYKWSDAKPSLKVMDEANNYPSDKKKKITIFIAVQNHDIPHLERLLEMGSDVNEIDSSGNNAIYYVFLNRPRWDSSDIHTASMYRIIKYLIEHGLTINSDIFLKVANDPRILRRYGKRIIELFINNGLNVDSKIDDDGNNMLHLYIKDSDYVEFLMKNGINIHLTNNMDETPLDIALKYGYLTSADLILNKKKVSVKENQVQLREKKSCIIM